MPIPVPSKGTSIHDWACQITRAVNAVTNFTVGPGLRIRKGPSGRHLQLLDRTSEINAGGGLRPFAVRWHEYINDEGEKSDGQWEIYLPHGCISVGGDCLALNRKAKLTSHHGDGEGDLNDSDDWYKLVLHGTPTPDQETVENGDGTPTTLTHLRYNVVVHAKTSVLREGIDPLDGPPVRGVYAVADAIVTDESEDEDDESEDDDHVYEWGDEFRQTVAVIRVTTGGEETVHSVERQIVSSAISISCWPVKNFRLVWRLDLDDQGSLMLVAVYCRADSLVVAGFTISGGDTLQEVTSASTVWLKLNLAGSPSARSLEIVSDVQQDYTDPTLAFLMIYEMEDGCLKTDLRESSLQNQTYA